MSETKYCPKCGNSFQVPQSWETNSPAPKRNCICSPIDDVIHEGHGEIQALHDRISDLQKWVDIALRLIPNVPTVNVPPSSTYDLNEQALYGGERKPQDVIDMVAACSEELQYYLNANKDKIIFCDLCLLCGATSNVDPRDPDKPMGTFQRVSVKSFYTCCKCQEIKRSYPQIYDWVGKMVNMLYALASYRPPDPIVKGRNILVP